MSSFFSGRGATLMITALLLASLQAAVADTYTFGVVPQFDARQIRQVWKPILTRLEAETGQRFQLVGTSTIPEFETRFLSGEFDFAYMNPYQVLKGAESVGYVPLVRDVGRTLHGIIVVRKDSPITRVEDLNGKKVAFPAPNALGATLVPRSDFKHTFGINVLPRYVQSHSSVYLNVVMGETAAGGGVQKTLAQQPPAIRDSLRVLYRTRDIPPHPVAAHPRVPEKVRDAVRNGFLSIPATEEGSRLLSRIPIQRIGRAAIDDYHPMDAWGLDEFYIR